MFRQVDGRLFEVRRSIPSFTTSVNMFTLLSQIAIVDASTKEPHSDAPIPEAIDLTRSPFASIRAATFSHHSHEGTFLVLVASVGSGIVWSWYLSLELS